MKKELNNLFRNFFKKENLDEIIIFSLAILWIIIQHTIFGFNKHWYLTDIGTIFGVIYILLLVNFKRSAYLFNIVSCIAIGLNFLFNHVYMYSVLYLAFSTVLMTYGYYRWGRSKQKHSQTRIKTLNGKQWLFFIGICAIVYVGMFFILREIGGNYYWLDAICATTYLFGVALSSLRYIEQYHIYNINCIFTIVLSSLLITTDVTNVNLIVLMTIYFAFDIIGLIRWNKIKKQQQETAPKGIKN